MKIVHIITRLIIGGAQENTLLSCLGQHRLGHDVTLITGPAIGPEGSLMERARSGGYRVQIIDEMLRAIGPRDTAAYGQLVRLIQQINPDVVHTHSSKAGILGRWAARQAGVRSIVHTIHGLAFTASTRAFVNSAYKILEWQAAPLTDRIVCVADSMRDQSLDAGIGTPNQYVTIYSGMETEPFLNPLIPREQVRGQLVLEDKHVVVGTIARLFELKGHDDLLDIAPRLCRQFEHLRFLWVGDGLLREKFETRMKDLGLRDRFILTGMVPPARVPELANAMDILVHPSRREGLARALPQGALAAIPAITYDIDGAKEAMIDGVSGIVLPPFDTEKLFTAISKLAGDGELRQKMGHAGRAFALDRFDARVMVDELEKLYRQIEADRG
jgi:glycosyltransferase involved in cell wall biosynthesis